MDEKILILSVSAASMGVLHTILGPDHYLPFIVIEDFNGDNEPEIILVQLHDTSSPYCTINVLDKDLELINSFRIDGIVRSLEDIGDKENTILVATSQDGKYYAQLFDMQNGVMLWSSPPLLGEVSIDSLHVFQKPGSPKKQLVIGTTKAIYLTR